MEITVGCLQYEPCRTKIPQLCSFPCCHELGNAWKHLRLSSFQAQVTLMDYIAPRHQQIFQVYEKGAEAGP